VRPTVTDLRQSAKTWRRGTKPAQLTARRKAPVGTTFGFSLNEQAAVRLDMTQATVGRRVSKRCVKRAKNNRKQPNCTRTVTVGTLILNARAGTNHVRFQGRLSRSKKLKPGRYTLIITATSAGLRSTPRSLSFTIVKG
jgi:hypothetical protein